MLKNCTLKEAVASDAAEVWIALIAGGSPLYLSHFLVSRAQSINHSYWYDSSLGQSTYVATIINAMIETQEAEPYDDYL